MNRHLRRKANALRRPMEAGKKRLDRTDPFVAFTTSGEHLQTLMDAGVRAMEAIGDLPCFDCMVVFLNLASRLARAGHEIDQRRARDPLEPFSMSGFDKKTFLENCSRSYDQVEMKSEAPRA